MSIFGKKSSTFPTDFDLEPEQEIPAAAQPAPAPAPAATPAPARQVSAARAPRYTIDQAIKLVSSLKGHNVSARVIASIMKQTLESVNIHFKDIIDDARLKESAINTETSRRDEMIKELSRKVEALQSEKIDYQKELERTVYVREFLQQALGEVAAAETAEAPAQQPAVAAGKSAARATPATPNVA